MDNSIKADIIFVTLFLLVLANIFVWQFIFSLDGNLKVVFFDVGEGDSIFIETPQGHQVLIDGGPSEQVLNKLPKVMPFWDKTIDLVVLTHPDYDHLAGLNHVLREYRVANVLWSGVRGDSKVFKDWANALNGEGAREIIAKSGNFLGLGFVKIVILYPLENISDQLFGGTSNESSVVLKIFHGKISFLMTGDITQRVEKSLLRSGSQVVADILKVAHHGSKSSTSREFLMAARPLIAVISVGRNNYGHPNQETLSNLKEFGIKVLRTDDFGDIRINSDGNNFDFSMLTIKR